MDLFDALTMLGGLCLFLFGMNIMGQALERRAGDQLRAILGKMTTKKSAGLFTGLGVTAVIQSSSATTVMVVGFVNSGLMNLKQAINVIMGANIGTTVTAWILSLSGINSSNTFIQLLKPTSFTPVLALIGTIFYLFSKNGKRKDSGLILLGFATLMFGMDTMAGAVSGLADVPAFQNLFLLFKNPLLGVLAGTILTAIIQSSSASVGILQALSSTGQISYGAAIPIIMGQNIGTCITAILSSIGANKNAKRAALVHLSFNIIGTIILLSVFCLVQLFLQPMLFHLPATTFGIAVAHSIFNILCTLILLPMSSLLERLAKKLVPDGKTPEKKEELDERLLATPAIALQSCHNLTIKMAKCAFQALKDGVAILSNYQPDLAKRIQEEEEKSDHYEDILGTYLVKLSTCQISEADSAEAAKLLRMIGDFERISDYGVQILKSAKELHEKKLAFSPSAQEELHILCQAVVEISDLSFQAFLKNDSGIATKVEPLEQVIKYLRKQMRTRHISRLQKEECKIETGFIWSDLLTNLGRVSDHCSNIAGCILDMAQNSMNLHASLRAFRLDESFESQYDQYAEKYQLAK